MTDNAYNFDSYIALAGTNLTPGNSPFSTVSSVAPVWTNIGGGRMAVRYVGSNTTQVSTTNYGIADGAGGLTVAMRVIFRTNVGVGYFIQGRTAGGGTSSQLRADSGGVYLYTSLAGTKYAVTTGVEYILRWKSDTHGDKTSFRLSSADDLTVHVEAIDAVVAERDEDLITLNIGNLTSNHDLVFDMIDLHWQSGSYAWIDPTDHTPDPPTGGTATAVVGQPTQLQLNWVNHPLATGTDIERNSVVIVSNHASSSYLDTGLTADTEYSYRLRAVG